MKQIETLLPHDCLLNSGFQDWLALVSLMKRIEVHDADLQRTEGRKKPKDGVRETIYRVLVANKGNVVSLKQLEKEVYGGKKLPYPQAINMTAARIKLSLARPEVMVHFDHVGWAIGVNRFKLTLEQIPLIYYLWSEMWWPLDWKVISNHLYGLNDQYTAQIIGHRVTDLQSTALPHTLVRIERRGKTFTNCTYRLIEKTDIAERVYIPDEVQPPFLSHKFQDWLSGADVGLMIRKNDSPYSPRVGKGKRFSNEAKQLCAILVKYKGYLLSYKFLSQIVYGDKNGTSKITKVNFKLRHETLENPEVIFTSKLGLAVGVDHLSLTLQQLRVLHTLWRSLGNFVPIQDLAEAQGDGGVETDEYNTIHHALSALRRKLDLTSYDIVRKKERQTSSSSYCLRKKG